MACSSQRDARSSSLQRIVRRHSLENRRSATIPKWLGCGVIARRSEAEKGGSQRAHWVKEKPKAAMMSRRSALVTRRKRNLSLTPTPSESELSKPRETQADRVTGAEPAGAQVVAGSVTGARCAPIAEDASSNACGKVR